MEGSEGLKLSKDDFDHNQPWRYMMYPDHWYRPLADATKALSQVPDVPDGQVIYSDSRGTISVTNSGRGLRWKLATSFGDGFLEIVQLPNAQILTMYHYSLKTSLKNRVRDSEQFSFGIRAKGAGDFANSLVFPDDDSSILYWGAVSRAYKHVSELPAGSKMVGAQLAFPLREASDFLDMVSSELVDAMNVSRGELESLPIMMSHVRSSPESVRCLGEMVHCSLEGGIQYDFLVAKVRELQCYVADRVRRSEQRLTTLYRPTAVDVTRLRKARALISNGFSEKISVRDIASDVDMTTNRFQVLFKQHYGETAHEYLTGLRMSKARALLRDGDLDVATVASRVGYAQASGFRQAFKKHFGVTPKEVRYE